jgi:hypothetical protein
MKTLQLSRSIQEVPGYGQLQRQIHVALRAQHPEWVQSNGDSPTCDSYDLRFAELLRQLEGQRSLNPPHDKREPLVEAIGYLCCSGISRQEVIHLKDSENMQTMTHIKKHGPVAVHTAVWFVMLSPVIAFALALLSGWFLS